MFENKIREFTIEGRIHWNNTMRMLLYKNDEDIFDKINFEDDSIYQNPFLNAYFSSEGSVRNNNNILNSILFHDLQQEIIPLQLDRYGKTYISKFGWYESNEEIINLTKDVKFEPSLFVEGTNIEILKYPIELLDQCYNKVGVEIEKITKEKTNDLIKAYNLIKSYVPEYFNLINEFASKSMIFNTLPENINSFAHKSAIGIGFYNAYQENYDEVFFIDDIAHQKGHSLMFTILHDKKQFFLIDDENTTIQSLLKRTKTYKYPRSVEIWFHALYTYYTSFTCLDACVQNKVLNKEQENEALGRILLYIYRCHYDLNLINNPINHTEIFNFITEEPNFENDLSKNIFTSDGLIILNEIKRKWYEMYKKYYFNLKDLTLNQQAYNFDFSVFKQENNL
ncbi:MAG: hypothetical protein H6604_04840 [Flavobacteriales bacterium]|nr:hypothetical protein [Flavobacteriales bacterium]